jgi:tetratricopeptide (TPR) repeat protein
VPTDSRQLLEQANAARRIGDVAQAASLFETLRVRYPRDPRAALASFELGRLRLDVLGDPPGAVQALKQSIALAPSGVFREDAEACLATAYARMRDHPRCELARRAYLDRYPEGTHATEMSALVCR